MNLMPDWEADPWDDYEVCPWDSDKDYPEENKDYNDD
jgi:hypothetical protein